MQGFNRSDRVAEMISREISYIIDREMRDTRLSMATVTDVDLSRDLKNAHIFISILGTDEEASTTVDVLNNAAKYIRTKLGARVVLRYVPKLLFILDTSATYGLKIDKLLDGIDIADDE